MMQQDSIVQTQQAVATDTVAREASRPMTPYQVLKLLPKDATPAQQDSAIQAWFKPGEIHYSERPDTLHLPGHDVGVNPMEVNLPVYYRENFFSSDTLFHSELTGGRFGVAGDPVPYTIRADNTITLLLLFSLVFTVVSFVNSRNFLFRHAKDFFHIPKTESVVTETTGEIRFQLFLVLLSCLQVGILAYLYITAYITDDFVLDSQYQLIPILFGVSVAYLLMKAGLYTVTNLVFFDGKKNVQWMKTLLFITSVEGVLLLPAVLIQVYFNLALENVFYYCVFVLILTKILTFYKCWAIFFRQISVVLQIILYFCALELIPLLVFGGALVEVVNELEINY